MVGVGLHRGGFCVKCVACDGFCVGCLFLWWYGLVVVLGWGVVYLGI